MIRPPLIGLLRLLHGLPSDLPAIALSLGESRSISRVHRSDAAVGWRWFAEWCS